MGGGSGSGRTSGSGKSIGVLCGLRSELALNRLERSPIKGAVADGPKLMHDVRRRSTRGVGTPSLTGKPGVLTSATYRAALSSSLFLNAVISEDRMWCCAEANGTVAWAPAQSLAFVGDPESMS